MLRSSLGGVLGIFLLSALLLVGTFGVTSASAALIDKDLYSEGDNLITLDTNTGLEWLDLSLSEDLYYRYVQLFDQGGWLAAGWRVATGAEVSTFLYINTGLEDRTVGNYSGTEGNLLIPLMEKIGITYEIDLPYSYIWRNYVVYDDGTDNNHDGRAYMYVNFYLYNGEITRTSSKWEITDDFDVNTSYPIFFVRDSVPAPVPEPSTLLLSGLGLLGMGAYIRKRRTN